MLKLKDLEMNKALDSKEMKSVVGGWNPMSLLLDGSTTMDNRVADVSSAFGLALDQTNAGAVTNNQAIQGGNGIVYAPVKQDMSQYSDMYLGGIGNTSVSSSPWLKI